MSEHVPINNVEEVGERKDDQEDHEHEVHTITDCLLDKLHIVGECREQPHPVEDLNPHEEAGKGSIGSHKLNWEVLVLVTQVDRCHVEEDGVNGQRT